MPSTSQQLLQAAADLRDGVDVLRFISGPPWVYNPLNYAWLAHQQYIQLHAPERSRVLFVGMNPGPWGMSQTGVPFGEVQVVRDWLEIDAPIGRPVRQHPKRPVDGLECKRSEISGRRFWGFFRDRFKTPANFFSEHFVISYCPLAFMQDSGLNVTPDKLAATDREALEQLCDRHLIRVVQILQPQWLIGVGNWAEQRIRLAVVQDVKNRPLIGRILHPSPASPAANHGWPSAVLSQLTSLTVW